VRYFNTTGPCDQALHYMVPAERRLPEARPLVERGLYFVVHAPRQTGKTTTLRALAAALTAEGAFAALHFSCETGQAAEGDYEAAEQTVLADIVRRSGDLPADCRPPSMWPDAPAGTRLAAGLAAWAGSSPRPLVLFFDEIDALRGASLISILRQLRAGFPDRPRRFPSSVVLCGMRDVRDYKAASGGDPERLGTASPFNIKVASLRIGDFAPDEVRELYAEHTAETGQAFDPSAVERAFELTRGQPWLVNALAREVIEKIGVPPAEPITPDHVEEAKERLILARQTHLDSLVARLMEPRVRRFIGPMVAGDLVPPDPAYNDDLLYCRDLGLVTEKSPVAVANPIYREVFVRVLAEPAESQVLAEPRSFVLPDGRLDGGRMLREFIAFWREHGELLSGGMPYHEIGPQLVLMAFLQRVANGGGTVDREYGVGRGRIDLLVRWPYRQPDGARAWQLEAWELKVWAPRKPDPLPAGLAQIDEYLMRLSLDTGILAIFDRRSEAPPWEARGERSSARTPSGREVTVVRL